MTTDQKILVSSKYIELTAQNCRENPDFDPMTCGSQMLKFGYQLMFGGSLDDAGRAVLAMLRMSDAFKRSTYIGMSEQ